MRLEGQAKGGFYPTPPRLIPMIGSMVNVMGQHGRNTVVRVLDPCCGNGDALASLAEWWMSKYRSTRVLTYGVELHSDRADEAAEKLDNPISSDLFRTSIANEAFDILFLNPPYDHDTADKRVEHAFLTHCTHYLKTGGVLIYLVPRIRLGISARYLGAMYHSLKCFWFPFPERDDYDQVVLFAQKKGTNKLPSLSAEDQIVSWSQGNLDDLVQERYATMYCTASEPGDIQFYARGVDPLLSSQEARKTGLWASREISDSLWPTHQELVRPLMPLRRGHMAMMVAAGFLNNLVLESGDERMLVRGKTTKEMILVEETEEKEVYRERLTTTVILLNLDTGEITDINTGGKNESG